MPKISVILPVYNGELYLEQSINSVLSQSYRDFELIIVDDCSTDKTSEIIQKYTKIDNRIKSIRNSQNLKLPASLNLGFSIASGVFWTWTSCDNIYLENAFEKLTSTLDSNKMAGLVYSSMQLIDEQGAKTGKIVAGSPGDLILRNVVGACFMYRRYIAEQVGDYSVNEFLCEDYEYWLRTASVASLLPIDDVLYLYRRHSQSLSGNHEREIIVKGIRLQKQFYPRFVDSRIKSAKFYAHLRARDIYNPFRQFYLFLVLYFSLPVFVEEIKGLVRRRFDKNEKN